MSGSRINIITVIIVLSAIFYAASKFLRKDDKPDTNDDHSIDLGSGLVSTGGQALVTPGTPAATVINEDPPADMIVDYSTAAGKILVNKRIMNLFNDPHEVQQINVVAEIKDPFSGLSKSGQWRQYYENKYGSYSAMPFFPAEVLPGILNQLDNVYNIDPGFHKKRWKEQAGKIFAAYNGLKNAGFNTTIIGTSEGWLRNAYGNYSSKSKMKKAVNSLIDDAKRFFQSYKSNSELVYNVAINRALTSLQSDGFTIINHE